jgi:hypothetical protein
MISVGHLVQHGVCQNPSCGVPFERRGPGRRSRFCPRCCKSRIRRRHNPQTLEATCGQCGSPFTYTKRRRERQYCDVCRATRRAEQERTRKSLRHVARKAGLRT